MGLDSWAWRNLSTCRRHFGHAVLPRGGQTLGPKPDLLRLGQPEAVPRVLHLSESIFNISKQSKQEMLHQIFVQNHQKPRFKSPRSHIPTRKFAAAMEPLSLAALHSARWARSSAHPSKAPPDPRLANLLAKELSTSQLMVGRAVSGGFATPNHT